MIFELDFPFEARGQALPIGCALIVATQSLFVCGHFWLSWPNSSVLFLLP